MKRIILAVILAVAVLYAADSTRAEAEKYFSILEEKKVSEVLRDALPQDLVMIIIDYESEGMRVECQALTSRNYIVMFIPTDGEGEIKIEGTLKEKKIKKLKEKVKKIMNASAQEALRKE